MKTSTIVYAKVICPSCEQNVETEITITVGDHREMHQYTIGDRISWRRHASVQNGGRPENGNIDAEGFSYSPVCGHSTFVKVIIRSDIIKDVFFDPDRTLNEGTPASTSAHQPAQAVQIPQRRYLPNQGKVTFNFYPEWLGDQRKKTVEQLTELGVDIYAPNPSAKYDEFRIMIPHGLHPATYIEMAYLMAKLADENFREPLIAYVDSYPQGVKYRLKNPLDE